MNKAERIAELERQHPPAVWVDVVDGVAGTEKFVNGTVMNPVNNLEDAEALARKLNIDDIRFMVAGEVQQGVVIKGGQGRSPAEVESYGRGISLLSWLWFIGSFAALAIVALWSVW